MKIRLAFLLITCVATAFEGCAKKETTRWNTYEGQFKKWKVYVDEKTKNGVTTAICVSLYPIDDTNFVDPPIPFVAGGRDYDNDGQFESFGIREKKDDGPDHMTIAKGGKKIWKPCTRSRENGITPFSDGQIAPIQKLLTEAKNEIRNKENLLDPDRPYSQQWREF